VFLFTHRYASYADEKETELVADAEADRRRNEIRTEEQKPVLQKAIAFPGSSIPSAKEPDSSLIDSPDEKCATSSSRYATRYRAIESTRARTRVVG